MSTVTSTFRGKAVVEAASTPTIYNVTCTLANTEYSQVLTSSTKRFLIRVRGNSTLRLAFVSGDTVTNYITVPVGCSYTEEELNIVETIYFQCSKAAQVVEILEWS